MAIELNGYVQWSEVANLQGVVCNRPPEGDGGERKGESLPMSMCAKGEGSVASHG